MLYDIIVLAAPASFLALAVLVLLSRRVARYAYLWSAFCAAAAVAIIGIQLTTRMVESEVVALVTARAAFTAGALACALFLSFAVAFLGMQRLVRWLAPAAGAVAVVFMALFWSTGLVLAGVKPFPHGAFMAVPGVAFTAYAAFVVFCFFFPMVLFVRQYRSSSGRLRLQLGYLLLAATVIGIASVGSLLITVESYSLLAFLPWLLMVFGPALVTYAIIRVQLWDIRTVIHKTFLWAGLSLAVIIPASWLAWALAGRSEHEEFSATFVATVLLFVVFGLHFQVLQPRLDQLFRRRTQDPERVLEEFNREILSLRGIGEFAELLLRTVQQNTFAQSVRMRVIDNETNEIWNVDRTGMLSLISVPVDPATLDGWARRRGTALQVGALASGESADRELDAWFHERGVQLVMPFTHEGMLLGWVEVGEKADFRAYTLEDFALMARVRALATVAMANALLFQQLRGLTRTLEARVTERTRELEAANKQLRELDRLKSEFFANVSHELRTPLTLIKAPLELFLQQDPATLPQAMPLQFRSMLRSANRLLRLINDLLDLSRIEAGKMLLRYEELDLYAMCQEVLPPFVTLGEQQGVRVHLEGAAQAPILVDAEKVENILINLMGNALKFTPRGGEVVLALLEGDEHLRLEVRDTGIGIAPEHLESIFGRFAQVEASSTRRFAGTGIGLSLVKELVELLGGHISVSSQVDVGSTFTVTLPRGRAHVREDLLDRHWVVKSGREGARVEVQDIGESLPAAPVSPPLPNTVVCPCLLVVEDNADLLAFLTDLLGRHYRILQARDGEAGVTMAALHLPDLVLSDVMMPRCSGYELTRRLRTEPRTAHIPIILLTARRGPEAVVTGLDAGADDYVGKPFSPEVLLARIRAQLRLRDLAQQLAQAQKLSMLGLLTAGLAHEVRNPANALVNALVVLRKLGTALPPEDREDAEELMGVVDEAARRILNLVSDMLEFSQADRPSLGPWWPAEAVAMTLRLLGPRAHVARVIQDCQVDEPVMGRAGPLNQVVMNLLDNALRAVGKSGEIQVRARLEGQELLFEVQDDGVGIPADMLSRVFDPFFTTREVGDGAGLGLHVCQRIVQDHGGRIVVRSVVGQGTLVQVWLPLTSGQGE